jgi:hypothetical protein
VSLLARGPRTYYIREENLERTTVSTASTRPRTSCVHCRVEQPFSVKSGGYTSDGCDPEVREAVKARGHTLAAMADLLPVVIDLGSYSTKAGYAVPEKDPTVLARSAVLRKVSESLLSHQPFAPASVAPGFRGGGPPRLALAPQPHRIRALARAKHLPRCSPACSDHFQAPPS